MPIYHMWKSHMPYCQKFYITEPVNIIIENLKRQTYGLPPKTETCVQDDASTQIVHENENIENTHRSCIYSDYDRI